MTRSQKRQVQRLCQTELLEEERKEAPKKKEDKSEVWRVKQKDDDRQGPGSSTAPVYMVFMLPSEFVAPNSDDVR